MVGIATAEKLQRIIYREFLIEPGLLDEVGLEEVPARLAPLLGCDEAASVATLTASPLLQGLQLVELQRLLAIRDMTIVSRTAAALSAELKKTDVTYDRCCRMALCYAVIESFGHVFSALRAASAKNETWARHHYLYGLVLGVEGGIDRAKWEVGIALQYEPYEEGRIRMRYVMDILEGRA